jgi:hypothetical protein
MKSHEFRGVLHAQPFCPFTFATVDGETYAVDAPEDAWLAPGGGIVAVSAPGGVALVGIEWITRVAFTPYPPGVTGRSERLMELKQAEPFVPFVIELADGRRFLVESADHIMIPRKGSTVVVADPDGLALLDSDQITEIVLRAAPPGLEGRVERLRKLRRAEPFVPFVLHLADGRRFTVTHAEGLTIPAAGTIAGFFGDGESYEVLDVDQITDVEPWPGAAPSTRS